MENITEQSNEIAALKKQLSIMKELAKALIENSLPGATPSQESVYHCATVFMASELAKLNE